MRKYSDAELRLIIRCLMAFSWILSGTERISCKMLADNFMSDLRVQEQYGDI